MLLQDKPDRVDGGSQDLGGVLDRVRALPDELVQTSDVYKGRVRPWKVEATEKAERRVPGDHRRPAGRGGGGDGLRHRPDRPGPGGPGGLPGPDGHVHELSITST